MCIILYIYIYTYYYYYYYYYYINRRQHGVAEADSFRHGPRPRRALAI